MKLAHGLPIAVLALCAYSGAYDVIWLIDPELGAALALDPMSGERVIASK